MGFSPVFYHLMLWVISHAMEEDASLVTWAHAVNSRSALLKELEGTVDFLEADVSMGRTMGFVDGPYVPIMAHPPDVLSDISLEEWIDVVISRNASKGVKLDFKSIDVVEPAFQILETRSDELNFTLWLNADVLYGPVNAATVPIDDRIFLKLCNQYFPKAVVSVGWTTQWFPSSPLTWHYEWKHVRKMADIIRCFGYEHSSPNFTFPVRAIYASRSLEKLQWLMDTVPGSTLTVWSSKEDPLLLEDLLKIRKAFPNNKVYYDVPNRLRSSFLKVKDAESEFSSDPIDLKNNQWMTLTRGTDHLCASNTYATNTTVVFGSFTTTAVLLKKLLLTDASNSFRVTGIINFFVGYDQFLVGSHELKMVVADVSLFSRNLTNNEQSSLHLSGSDTDIIWEAMNSSHFYTFNHDFLESSFGCRIFKLDTSSDRSFQAWSLPCDFLETDKTFDAMIAHGKQEIPSNKRAVLPKGPFMIGFISSGPGHAVVYDFEISGKEEEASSALSVISSSFGTIFLILMSAMLCIFVKNYIFTL